ncbi:dihydrolipoamide succinyltransferase, partial [Agrobacterium vitis]|nr:dihydrolipoamide succinyltransferase [Agrobacterium vitis]
APRGARAGPGPARPASPPAPPCAPAPGLAPPPPPPAPTPPPAFAPRAPMRACANQMPTLSLPPRPRPLSHQDVTRA